jgi:hypothetical protein
MPWVKPRAGIFSGWSGQEPAGVATDPYLLWAEATGFVHESGQCSGSPGTASTVPPEVPVLIELGEGWTGASLASKGKAWVTLAPLYADEPHFVTARIRPGFMREVTQGVLQGAVRRVELGVPKRPERAPDGFRLIPMPKSSTRTLLGVIDTGCAFAHASLRRGRAGQTRILSIWDQESCVRHMAFVQTPRISSVPEGLDYGQQILRSELETLMSGATTDGILNEDACYEAANYRLLRPAVTHGAHILDLLAGPVAPGHRVWTRVPGEPARQPDFARTTAGDAVDSDIVFVQFPRDALGDTTGGWLCVHVLDAVRYILACKGDETERVVINLSYGSQVGPHDGTATLERALADLCARHPSLDIVLPVGNSFDRRSHASVPRSRPAARVDLELPLPQVTWSVPVDCEECTFVELWMPQDARTGVRLTPPLSRQPGSPVVRPGECQVWPDADHPSVGIFHLADPACGTGGSMVLIALAPTTTFRPDVAIAPAGQWRLELACQGDDMPQVDAYIARNDPDIGQMKRGRTARFVSAGYDPQSSLRPADDDDLAGTPDVVSRRGTMNWTFPSTTADARGLHVVAGRVLNTQFPDGVRKQYHPPYSSAGPDRRGQVIAPEGSCVTDESIVLRGVRAGGTRSGGHVRIVGTSTAAPQRARLIANRVQTPPVPPHEGTLPPIDLPLEGTTAYDCPDQ